jgi:PAS domain S-box-containing protein
VDRVCGPIEQAGLAAAVEQAADGIVLTDASGKIQYVNPEFTAMTGYTRDEVAGQNPRLLKSGQQSDEFYKKLWRTIAAGKVWHGELVNRRKDGRFYHEEMQISPVHDSGGVTTGYIAIKRDVTLRRAQDRTHSTLAAIVESSEDAIMATSVDGLIHSWNRGAEAVFGYARDEVLGKNVSILMAPERQSDLDYFTGQLLQGIDVSQFESLCLRKDGSRFHVSVTGSPVRSSTGEILSMCAVLRDTSQRWQSEERLRQSEARFRGVFDDAPVGIYLAGPDSRIIQVNKAFCRMLGYSKEELLARSWPELCHPDDEAMALERKKQLHSSEVESSGGETRYIDRNGALVWSHVRVSLLRASDGSPLCSVVHVEDITESKRAEGRLRESEERFRTMADCSPSMMWVTDNKGNVEFISRSLRKFCGIESEEADGIHWHIPVHPDDLAESTALFAEARSERKTFKCESRVRRADGEWRLLGTNAEPRRSPDGQYLGHIGLCADITERRQAEQALAESEHRFRIMADNCPIGIWVTDAQGKNRFVNRTYLEFCDLTAEQIEQNQWKSLIHPDDAEEFFKEFERALREHSSFHAVRRGLRGDGTWRWVESQALPRFSPDGVFRGLVGTSEDITERKLTELALQNSEEKFRQLAENIREVFWVMNADGTEILYVSPAYEQMWGRSCKSLYEAPMNWLEAVHPGDRERAHETFIKQVQGESIDSEYRILTPNGQEKWIRDRAFLVREGRGEVARIVGIAEEMTERKRYETELIQARDGADAANLAKSRFLAIMSHELRTPLNVILGFAEFLELEMEEQKTESWLKEIRKIRKAGSHLLDLISDVMDLSKIEAGKMELAPSEFDASAVVAEVVSSAEPLAAKNRVRLRVQPEPVQVRADRMRFRQCLFNLVSNACKFTKDGEVRIEQTACERDGRTWCKVRVVDTGIGIRSDDLGKIFEEFSQVDSSISRKYGGTGLGLPISRRLMQMMGGDITVESVIAQGSIFTLWLPCEPGSAGMQPVQDREQQQSPGTEGIMEERWRES